MHDMYRKPEVTVEAKLKERLGDDEVLIDVNIVSMLVLFKKLNQSRHILIVNSVDLLGCRLFNFGYGDRRADCKRLSILL